MVSVVRTPLAEARRCIRRPPSRGRSGRCAEHSAGRRDRSRDPRLGWDAGRARSNSDEVWKVV